jgi:hypothetical protein
MESRRFSKDELRLFIGVLRQACADVEPADDVVRSKIANRILSMACDGERDFEILRSYATQGLGKSREEAPAGALKS